MKLKLAATFLSASLTIKSNLITKIFANFTECVDFKIIIKL